MAEPLSFYVPSFLPPTPPNFPALAILPHASLADLATIWNTVCAAVPFVRVRAAVSQ